MLSNWEAGQAIVTRLEDGRVRVDRADQTILISTDLLASDNFTSLIVEGDLVMFGDIDPVTYRITERSGQYVQADRVT